MGVSGPSLLIESTDSMIIVALRVLWKDGVEGIINVTFRHGVLALNCDSRL